MLQLPLLVCSHLLGLVWQLVVRWLVVLWLPLLHLNLILYCLILIHLAVLVHPHLVQGQIHGTL